MNIADLIEFGTRDRESVAVAKSSHWRELKREHGLGACVSISDELRRHVLARRPAWQEEIDGTDIATHVRVGEALRSVAGLDAR